jgi:uncharacterized protein
MGNQGQGPVDLPLFPLGTVLFPGMPLPLHLFEPRYRRLMREHHLADPVFGVVLTRRGREVADQPETHEVGTAAGLVGLRRYPDDRFDVVVRGGRRFRVLGGDWEREYLTGRIEWLEEPIGDDAAAPDLLRRAVGEYRAFVAQLARAVGAEVPEEHFGADPVAAAYALAARLPLNTWERQRLLELPTATARLNAVADLLARERRLVAEAGAGGMALDHPFGRFSPN